MSKKDNPHPFGNFLDRLADQLRKIEEIADEGSKTNKRDGGPDWSIGWKFSLGTGGEKTGSSPAKKSPATPMESVRSGDGSLLRDVPVQPRALGFFEVHDEGDQLLVIAELPGLSEEDIEAELTHDDVLTIRITTDGHIDSRDLLLPSPARSVEIEETHGIWTIRCALHPRPSS